MQRSAQTSKMYLVGFMLLMVVGLGSSVYFFGRLQTAKRNLKDANASLTEANKKVTALNDSILLFKEELVKVQKEMVRLVNGPLKATIQDSSTYVALGNAVDSTWNLLNPTKFEQAMALERKAFEAIRDGHFQEAIKLLSETEEVYPNFHQVHEIKAYLEGKVQGKTVGSQPHFRKEEVQSIQKGILRQYTWKAPADVVAEIKEKTK